MVNAIVPDAAKETRANSTPSKVKRPNLEAQSLRVTSAFGQIVTVYMRSSKYRTSHIGELEWLVAPAVATGQYALAEMRDERTGLKTPVGAVLWASVSPEIDARLTAAAARPRLKPEEWASGPIPWLMDAVGQPRATAALLKKLVEQGFAKTGLKTIDFSSGKPTVRILAEARTCNSVEDM